jgi:hypothetical protein
MFAYSALLRDWGVPNRRFKFQKRSQLFIGTHNETFSIVAMRVCNPDCSPVGTHG